MSYSGELFGELFGEKVMILKSGKTKKGYRIKVREISRNSNISIADLQINCKSSHEFSSEQMHQAARGIHGPLNHSWSFSVMGNSPYCLRQIMCLCECRCADVCGFTCFDKQIRKGFQKHQSLIRLSFSYNCFEELKDYTLSTSVITWPCDVTITVFTLRLLRTRICVVF